jgi:alpha-tubulin suppressor-like RCC1 family protein
MGDAGGGDASSMSDAGSDAPSDGSAPDATSDAGDAGDGAAVPPPACSLGQLARAVSVTAGVDGACAVAEDGSLWCWGNNIDGRLGDGTTTARKTAEQVAALGTSVVQADTDPTTGLTCAVETDGSAWCWGGSALGHAALAPEEQTALGKDVAKVEASCAIKTSGALFCLNDGAWNMVPTASPTVEVSPLAGQSPWILGMDGILSVPPGPFDHVARIAATVGCFVKTDGTLSCIQSDLTVTQVTALGTSVADVAGGLDASLRCARLKDHTLECWGANIDGQLGNGTFVDSAAPVAVSLGAGAKAVSLGGAFGCAVRDDGAVLCWGDTAFGALGNGVSDQDLLVPTQATGAGNTSVDLRGGHIFSCAQKADATLACVGDNTFGQLGDGTQAARGDFTPVIGLGPVLSYAVGTTAVCAVAADGSLWCWGGGDGGGPAPVRVMTLGTSVASVSVGTFSRCAVKKDASLWCWGDGMNGAIGTGTTDDTPAPVPVTALGNTVAAVSVGDALACALLVDGTVSCWTSGGGLPTKVAGLDMVVEVSVGFASACARKQDGTLFCWGTNDNGEVGDGTTTPRPAPVQVTALGTKVTHVSVGYDYACAIESDQTVWCWGKNDAGQMGNGTQEPAGPPQTIPAQVNGLDHVVTIDAWQTLFGGSVCATKADHTAWCWGANDFGQLGIRVGIATPVPVTCP